MNESRKTSMKPRRESSLRSRIALPVVCVLLIQMILYILMFSYGGITKKINDNATDILVRQAENLSLVFENEMLHRWSNVSQCEEEVLKIVQEKLEASGKTYRDIKEDAALNEMLLTSSAKAVIDLLRRTSATGAFLVLDGVGVSNGDMPENRGAFYIRDMDPTTFSQANSDLLLERGLPSLARELQISLDTYWASVLFEEQDSTFYSRSITEAKKDSSLGSAAYGYWHPGYRLSPEDIPVISYSIPLIAQDGTVFGALGVDVAVDYINSLLRMNHYDKEEGTFLLTFGSAGSGEHQLLAQAGPLVHQYFGKEDGVQMLPVESTEALYTLNTPPQENGRLFASVRKLGLYNNNTPFQRDAWSVSVLQEEDTLFALSNHMHLLLYLVSGITFLLGAGVIWMVVHSVTKPLKSLMNALSTKEPVRSVHLPQMGIAEIDSLSGSIEKLSKTVARSASRFSEIVRRSNAMLGVFEYTREGTKAFCSGKLYEIMDWANPDGQDHHLELEEFFRRMEALELCGESLGGRTYRLLTEHGTPRWLNIVENSTEDDCIGVVSDVTEQMLEKEKIEYERDYDTLTKLFNRRAFRTYLSTMFLRRDQLKTAAVVMWDLDNLKYVNDTYGHECGDRYILGFVRALREVESPHCKIARRSGDEFYMFFHGYGDREEIRHEIEKVSLKLKESDFVLPNGREYGIHASGGVAWYPRNADSWGDLVRYADFAMYCVKNTTKGAIEEFSQEKWEKNSLLVNAQEEFHELLDKAAVHFEFQPIIEVATGGILGYEALMRSSIAPFDKPADILRVAKSQSQLFLIEKLTAFGVLEAFSQMDQRGEVPSDAKVFINSLPDQSLTKKEIELLADKYADYLSRVVIEITENEAIDATFQKFKTDVLETWGAQLAIDDYGVGHSNLSVLLDIVPNILKVDISIIRNIHHRPDSQLFLQGLSEYCRKHGIKILAEGVETREELETCIQLHVDYLQGFYLAKPGELLKTLPDALAREIKEAYEKVNRGSE